MGKLARSDEDEDGSVLLDGRIHKCLFSATGHRAFRTQWIA
jgi:hypothetical protein